ncbi:o-succinylbenzoate--CoA ligase [Kineococcus terrestris]|uniref:o-succinylbenzoate--CoA ligase n=1 Tax=Kineococcus terrestris TaxID=2044856 RepID=UPI0034DB3176
MARPHPADRPAGPAARRVAPLPVPAGEGVLRLLPALAGALDGRGDALHPHAADHAPHPAVGAGEPLAPDEDDPADPTAVVVATSGSTGVPKPALLSAGALRASAAATAARLGGGGPGSGLGGGEQWLLALPGHHVAGLQVLLRSVRAGTEPVVADLRDGFTARAFTAAVARATGRRLLTSLVPTQLARLLDAGGAEGREARAALASCAAVLVGAAATPPVLLERARAAGVRVVTTYGSSETCGGCVYDGVPLDGVVASLEPSAEPGGAGRLVLSGPVVARGYRGRPGDPAFTRTAAGRAFRTDDTAALGADGRVDVLGRVDDVVVTGGLKVAPAAVEAVLAEHPGVREVAVVGVPDPEWGQAVVAVVVPAARGCSLEELREAVRARLGAHAAPRRLLLLEELPLRGPGKPDRSALRALAAAPGARLGTAGDARSSSR